MSVKMITFGTREFWLQHRQKRIGGSDIGSIIGVNPWKTNVQLWREKMGLEKAEDISGKPGVRYGIEAEKHLRALFALDHPDLDIEYVERNSWSNDDYPFAYASMDGWMHDKDGNFGVLEIKTASIFGKKQLEKWEGGVPDTYFAQLMWYMMVTDAKFAWLSAMLRWDHGSDVYSQIRQYYIAREDVEDDIAYVAEQGEKFYECLQSGTEPALLLPTV